MGSPADEPGRSSDEIQHEVTLTQGFWMLETEVTQAMWKSAMGRGIDASRVGPKMPVCFISWYDCQRFIAELNVGGYAPSGFKFRLPTEAEWEYACRAGTTGPCAGSPLDAFCWYRVNSGGSGIDYHAVAQKKPNAWGLYDMHGNVAEWCADWYGSYGWESSQTDPTGPTEGFERVVRGGGYDDAAEACRSASRDFSRPSTGIYGFRLVLSRVAEQQEENGGTSPTGAASDDWDAEHDAGTRKVLAVDGVEYAFRYSPAGTFTMGSPENEPQRRPRETQREVTLTRGFWTLETEVTQTMWKSAMGGNPMTIDDWIGPNKPVGNVSWNDCQAFIEKLNSGGYAPAGFKFRLPTEAEWEYACRAGTTGPYAGSSLDSLGWYADNSDGDNRDVARKMPNAWGLYDMHGNVWEQCADWYGVYDTASQTDPTGPSEGSNRVMRGGCCSSFREDCRAACRFYNDPTERLPFYGFRLVLSREL